MKQDLTIFGVLIVLAVFFVSSSMSRPVRVQGGPGPADSFAVQPDSTITSTGPTTNTPAPSATATLRPTATHAQTATLGVSPQEKKTAFIIGISNAPGADPIPGSKTDALTVRDALLRYGFLKKNITMLLDGQATRAAILDGLADLAERSTFEGIAVVSITTHASSNATFGAWDGRVSAHELGDRLGRARGRVWTIVATCYAGGFAVPGVVGSGRIGVFSSSSNDRSWQAGSAGSWINRYMIKSGMVDGGAPDSVESAFAYAKKNLQHDAPDRVPFMTDGVDGDLRLGPVNWMHPSKPAPSPETEHDPTKEPAPTPSPSSGGEDDQIRVRW